MIYPGMAYCLIVQFVLAPTIYGIIVGVRYFRSQSLREYTKRKMKILISTNDCTQSDQNE